MLSRHASCPAPRREPAPAGPPIPALRRNLRDPRPFRGARFVSMAGQGTRATVTRGRRLGLAVASAMVSALVLTCFPALARAEEAAPPRVEAMVKESQVKGVTERDYFAHPYGLVEFGVGVLALPDAKLCGGSAG